MFWLYDVKNSPQITFYIFFYHKYCTLWVLSKSKWYFKKKKSLHSFSVCSSFSPIQGLFSVDCAKGSRLNVPIQILLIVFRWESCSRCIQCEICLQSEGRGAHAAVERGCGKWLVPCQQQVRRQPHTSARLWNHPASASSYWPGGVLRSAWKQLRALCHPAAIRGGRVRAGVFRGSHTFYCNMSSQSSN